MENELVYLYFSLFIALLLAPTLTNSLFLNNSKIYRISHAIALAIVSLGVFFDLNYLLVIWPLFCFFGLLLYLKNKFKDIFSVTTVATFIPFIFSVIASVWLVAGSNDLYLLGYDKSWSFYASLHGNYLGWIFIGCLASLSRRNDSKSIYYTIGCYVCFVLFLLVALGIDGVPYVKPIGVIGLTIAVPSFIGLYLFNTTHSTSRLLASTSFIGILLSMTLAILNEFWTVTPQSFLGTTSMVTIHGLINSLIVTPLFYFAIKIEKSY